LVVHVPDTWSFEDAAQLGIAPFTALRTLYDTLELPLPLGATASTATATATAATTTTTAAANQPQSRTPILVGGGATSVGQYVVQFAKLSGLYVIATASERNFSLVRSLGADVVVDYRDPVAAAKQIREAAPNLQYATDCAIDGTSPAIVAASLAGQGTLAHITTLPYPPAEGVRILSSVVFDFLGKVRRVPDLKNFPPPAPPRFTRCPLPFPFQFVFIVQYV
jgi:NADPH:quinone reductase-like Zn-dependent oxidoreductase